MKTGRRAFIQKAGVVVGGGMLLGHHLPVLSKENNPSGQVRIMEPFHVPVLNWRHGERFEDGLKIKVQGEIPPGSSEIWSMAWRHNEKGAALPPISFSRKGRPR